MLRICIRMLRIPFEWYEFVFKSFQSFLNDSNFHSNASNLSRMVWFAFECFASLLNGSNLHSNALNPFQMVRISIRMFRIAFECFDPFRIVRICIQMIRITFELFEFAFWMLLIPLEWLEFAFECFESLSNCSKLHINASNRFRKVRIWFRMLR